MRRRTWTLFGAVVVTLWLLALGSYVAGNPAAASALVGIPLGALGGGAVVAIALPPDYREEWKP